MAEMFDGDRCCPNLLPIPGGVDGVVIATRPALMEELVRQCVSAGVPRMRMSADGWAPIAHRLSPLA